MMMRFSIRALLLLTLLIAVFVARPLHRASLQRQAREWVAEQRGHCLFKYGHGTESEWYITEAKLGVPEFLIRTLGIDVFNPVETVVFDCDELTSFEPLIGMDSLQSIHVNIEMSPEIDFSPLAKIPELQSLYFTEWSFLSDEQFVELRELLPEVKVVSESHSGGETAGM